MPDGFTPPSVTVTIEKVFKRTAGEGDNGTYSYQDVAVVGGKLKLKNLDPFPEDRIGETVTLKAYSSPKHGLTGMKVAHEEYQGKIYDKLVITPTCEWVWAETNKNGSNGHPATNGNGAAPKAQNAPAQRTSQPAFNLESHLLACAEIADSIATRLSLADDSARQACFATVCIDAQRHNVILGTTEAPQTETDGRRDAFLAGVKIACKLLNDEGYDPHFKPTTLDRYINHEFQVAGGLANLSTPNIEKLIKKLSDLLDTHRANKVIEPEPEVSDPDDDVPF